ncbi:MAG TPA: hypothetical protein VMU38_09365, partial [Candidatus Binatia bacterium]|nr:hypothetical protein [Candidatus Binatia bacterium]
AQAVWGPDGRQRTATINAASYSAHWDGDALLFYASGTGSPELYIGKDAIMDSAGNFSVADRDQSGEQVTTHGIQGGTAWFDSWNGGSTRNVYLAKLDQSKPYAFFQIDGSCGWTNQQNQTYYQCPFYPEFAMQRPDGYSMVGGYVQGARTYDPTGGQWLTPDPYSGSVHDPMSQKPFMWNDNNPVEYSDPSGYCPLCAAIFLFYLANAPEINAAVQDFVEGEAGVAGVSGNVRSAAERAGEESVPTVVLYKSNAKPTLGEDQRFLDLPTIRDGTARSYWIRNYSELRSTMSAGKPIEDSYTRANGTLIDAGKGSFLNAERATLRDRGWTYDPRSRLWSPPKPKAESPHKL